MTKNQNAKKLAEMVSLDQMLTKVGGSIFSLARLTMIRALEINVGKPPLIEYLSTDKETTIAFREVALGKVALKIKDRNKD